MAQSAQSIWANLPKEIVESLGAYLDANGWAAARGTCKNFSSITHGIGLLEIDLERDAHRWMMVLTCVARLFPRLTSVALLCGSRITPAIFAERMAALSITSIQLQELELRFLYLSNPRLGSWLEDLSGVTELRQLRLLRLAGGATPPPGFFEQLISLKQLRVLEVLPGVYGQIAGYDMDVGQGDADSHPINHMGVGDAHLSAIGRLTQLQQVTVKVCPQETTPAGLAGLTALGLLDSLEHLALYDAELPADSLAQHLSAASRLSSLQFGLSTVAPELSTLRKLPKLQEVGLDTAFLPSLQELVSTAGAAKIPASGPGSITSLCLLDQTVSSSQQLACLTQLSSLAELVLVNPLMQAPPPSPAAAPPSPAAAAAAAGSPQHHHHYHNQQQQQSLSSSSLLPVDLAALSGLQSLRLLQVDVGLRGAVGGSAAEPLQPLQLMVTEDSLRQLAQTWTALETLDLSGFGPDMLSEGALAALSCFTTLRALSVMHPEGSPHLAPEDEADFDAEPVMDPPLLHGLAAAVPPPAPAAAAAGGGNGGGNGGNGGSGGNGSDSSKQRSVPWWTVPRGLMSLCLSHMDISGRGMTQCGEAYGGAGGNSGSSSSSGGIGGCCLVPAAVGQQQRQQLLPGLGLGLSLFQNRPSPLRPLSKRRRQTQHRTDQADASSAAAAAAAAAGGAGGVGSAGVGGCSDDGSGCGATAGGDAGDLLSRGCCGDDDDAAAAAAAAAAGGGSGAHMVAGPPQCSCASVLPRQFSGLQALWLEHVSLPPSFLPRVLPVLASSLESLALLHVAGTVPEDMTSLGSLSALTSLRLIPSDHDVGGLEPMLKMKHLKKLSMKLTHLRPTDLAILHGLRSLFCLSLSAPCVNGSLYPGFPSAVRLQHVEEVVESSLPYCDFELQAEPDMTAVQ